MTELKTRIMHWVQAYIGQGPLFLVDVQITPAFKRSLVSVYVDTMEGVSIDACAALSRALGHVMEEEAWMQEAYQLEVSSPGLDAPLKQDWQFQKNLGRRVKVWMRKSESVEGELLGYADGLVELLPIKTIKHRSVKAKESIKIPLVDTEKIKVQVTF